MNKQDLLAYIRNLKQVIDYYVTKHISLTKGVVDDDILDACNKLVETGTTFNGDFYNFLYKEVLFFEELKRKCTNCDAFLKNADMHYIENRNQLTDMHKEFYKSFIHMNINRLICEIYDIYGE